jgi:hypothetical protein
MSATTLNRLTGSRPRFTTTRHQLTVVVILLAALTFYLWTAGTSYPFTFQRADLANGTDAYNLLTSALLHGHLYLPLQVPAGLPKLSDPYNPVVNAAYEPYFHDLILYHDHFYSAWGPSPTILFMLVRITGYRLPNSLAVAVYCFAGLTAAVALMHRLARRFVPGMPNWMLAVATIGLALTNVAPFLLRRPAEYEVAISGAYCFEMVGLYFVATAGLDSRLRLRRMLGGSLLLGLALLARPTMAVDLPLIVVIAWLLFRRGRPRLRVLVTVFTPFVVCVIALLAYNALRFGGVGDFGTQYQLAGIEVLHRPSEQLSYIPPGLFSYLFIPAQLSLGFPHVFLQTTAQYPFTLPHGYQGTPGVLGPEYAGGILPTMPITVLLLFLPLVWLRRREGERDALLVIGGGVLLALGVMLLLAYALFGTTQRYEVDYASLGLMPAFLLWGVMIARLRPGSWRRRAVASVGIVLTMLGAAAGIAVSFTGYLDLLMLNHPAIYSRLEDLTSPVVTLVAEIEGAPQITSVTGPAVSPPLGSPYTHFEADGSSAAIGGDPTQITIVSPRTESAAIIAVASASAVPLKGQVLIVTEPGEAPKHVPVIARVLRIPVTLHRGLNQVDLQSEGATATQLSQTELDDLRIGT